MSLAQNVVNFVNEQQPVNNLLIIDPTVEYYQSLIANVLPNTEVVVLDPEEDGVEPISKVLAKHKGISSLHIVSHGAVGSLQLGSTKLNADNLLSYSKNLQQWANALTDDADILLYGCDVAKGEVGKAFVQRLSEITGAWVAASDNLTGSSSLGGDWNLEFSTGNIQTPLVFQPLVKAAYSHVLATFTVTNTNDSGAAISYTENAAPIVIDSGATVIDIGSPNFNAGTLTVRFTNGTAPSDRLAIRNQGNAAGQIGLDGRIINYGGTGVGTFIGGIDSENLVVIFNSAATPAAVQALLQNITFSNVSENPTGSRTVEVVVTDGSNGISNAVTKNITLIPVNDAPIIGRNVVIYNGATDTLPTTTSIFPNAKGWIYNSTPGAVITTPTGVTNLNTTANNSVQAGFANIAQTLNNTTGYTVSFNAQLLAESHAGSDRNNDGKDDRAGFSVLVVSSDNTKAIELGFWENRIWAQDDGTTQANPALQPGDSPQSNFRTLFTQAEFTTFDTKTNPVKYDLTVQGDNYTLFANGNTILSGKMRNYTAFSSFPANLPYRSSNNIFFGDNTTSAQASVNLGSVAVTTNTTLPTLTATEGTPLKISNFSITDLDAGTSNITVNLSVGKGSLTVSNVTGGVTNITNNGTGNVTLTGAVNQINTTLAATGLDYQINNSVFGTDTLNISVNDGINTTQKTETINIQRVFNGVSGTRTPITGTDGDDLITPGRGAKILTGGSGNDQFIFTRLLDAGSTIADFTPGSDKIVLTQLLNSIVPSGYNRSNTLTDGYVKFVQGTTNNTTFTTLQIDPDGSGLLIARPFLQLSNITLTQLNNVNNFVF